MNKKFIIAWLVVFVFWMAGSYVVHGTLLRGDYAGLPNLFRAETESQRYFPLVILAHVMMAGAFAWIYSRGMEAKPWFAQGLRFGLVMAMLTAVPTYTIYYAVQNMPGTVTLRQIIFDGILIWFLGAVVAFVYRNTLRT